jgi:Mn2+/Fe2+ NRAMP family transporter
LAIVRPGLSAFRERPAENQLLFLAAIGPGIITMTADNDAGGISTYAQTGAKTGFNLLWAFIILVPMAYYVQEMTVRFRSRDKAGSRRGYLRWIWKVLGLVF